MLSSHFNSFSLTVFAFHWDALCWYCFSSQRKQEKHKDVFFKSLTISQVKVEIYFHLFDWSLRDLYLYRILFRIANSFFSPSSCLFMYLFYFYSAFGCTEFITNRMHNRISLIWVPYTAQNAHKSSDQCAKWPVRNA